VLIFLTELALTVLIFFTELARTVLMFLTEIVLTVLIIFIEQGACVVNESMLTGESVPQKKDSLFVARLFQHHSFNFSIPSPSTLFLLLQYHFFSFNVLPSASISVVQLQYPFFNFNIRPSISPATTKTREQRPFCVSPTAPTSDTASTWCLEGPKSCKS
jgi:hypothetical protein